MSKFNKMIGQQFGNPQGFVGRMCCKIMNIINKRMYEAVVREIDAEPSSTILDVGYGNGYLLKKLYKKFSCNLCGIEVSSDVEKQAHKCNKRGIEDGKIQLLQADCCDMPFEAETFDFVTTVNTIYFWQDTLKGLAEIHRVLKDGGVFCNAVYTQEWLKKLAYTREGFKFFDKEDYVKLGKEAGFHKVETKEIKQGKNFVVIYTK